MPTTIALIRGVNVGGKTLKMEQLRKTFEALGHTDVITYIQSGNVLFTPKSASGNLSAKIEARILADSGLTVSVLLKTDLEIKKVLGRNPFVKESGINPSKLHVTFLSAAPTKAALAVLEAVRSGKDRFYSSGEEIFLCCPDGYARSKLTNNAIERILSVSATTRNWNTVKKLYDCSQIKNK